MGTEQQFETGQTPHVIIARIHGNLHVHGGGETRVSVTGARISNEYRFDQDGNEIRLGDLGDCHLTVPSGARLTLGEVHGNAQLGEVHGQVNLEKVHGNLRVTELGPLDVGRIEGDFKAQELADMLVVGQVRGNFNANEVRGNVQLDHCDGNCTLHEIDGTVTVGRVRGNLHCHESGPVTADNVNGNMTVKELEGNVQVSRVGGNLIAIEMSGDLNAENVGGNLRVREVTGCINAIVGGTAKLDLHEATTPFVAVQAGGDVRCLLSPQLDATLKLRAGKAILIKGLPIPFEDEPLHLDYVVGAGEGQLELTAGHRIRLFGTESDESMADWDVDGEFHFTGDFNERATELVQQVAEQVELQVEAFTHQLNERLAEIDNGDAIAAKVQTKVQSAMRQAEEKIAEAMRRSERQAGRRAERHAAREARRGRRGHAPMPPVPPMPPMGGRGGAGVAHVQTPPSPTTTAPKPNPASPEERMLVLKMLEEGKISVDQAEKLLGAMGSD